MGVIEAMDGDYGDAGLCDATVLFLEEDDACG